jgi:hypothetical protein
VLHCCIEREVLRQEALQDSATEHVVELQVIQVYEADGAAARGLGAGPLLQPRREIGVVDVADWGLRMTLVARTGALARGATPPHGEQWRQGA